MTSPAVGAATATPPEGNAGWSGNVELENAEAAARALAVGAQMMGRADVRSRSKYTPQLLP